MKCRVARCPAEALAAAPKVKRGGLIPPLLALCAPHAARYAREYDRHFKPIVLRLARRWLVRNGIAKDRVGAVLEEMGNEARLLSWQATWLQMVDLELLQAGGALGSSKVDEGPPKPKPSVGQRAQLPEHATRAGQAAIAARAADAAQVDQQLQADLQAYAKGRRMELEHDLRVQRREEAVARAKQRKGAKAE